MILLTPVSWHIEKTKGQMYIQHITPLSVSLTMGAEGTLHHFVSFISTLVFFSTEQPTLCSSMHMFPVTYKNTQKNSN